MTKKEVIEYLKSYQALNQSINQKLDELSRLRALAEKSTSVLSGMPKGFNDREEIYAKMIDLSAEIDGEIDKYVDKRAEIETVIEQVEDEKIKTILKYRYINGLTIEQTAEKMELSGKTIKRLTDKAVMSLNVPLFF